MEPNFVKKLDTPIKVYKVVREDNQGGFHSIVKSENASIQYRYKKEVKPNVEHTPIFTFRSLRAAYNFKHASHFIMECITRELFAHDLRRILPTVAISQISPERLYDFWCLPLEKERFSVYRTVYKSKQTVLVSSLVPINVLTNQMLLEKMYA